MNVYTKIDGKLAQFTVEALDHETCIREVKKELGKKHIKPILAVIYPPKQLDLFE